LWLEGDAFMERLWQIATFRKAAWATPFSSSLCDMADAADLEIVAKQTRFTPALGLRGTAGE